MNQENKTIKNTIKDKSIDNICSILKLNYINHCIDYNMLGDIFINIFFNEKYYALLSIINNSYILKNEDIEATFLTEHELISFIKKESYKINNKYDSLNKMKINQNQQDFTDRINFTNTFKVDDTISSVNNDIFKLISEDLL